MTVVAQHIPGLPYSEDWVAARLLEAPDGVMTRADLHAAAPPSLTGSIRKSSGNPKAGSSNGKRSTRYVNMGIKTLVKEGLVVMAGPYVAIADRPALVAFMEDEEGPTGG